MNNKILVLTETSYQLAVVKNCDCLIDATFIHWNVRGDVTEDYARKNSVNLVNSRISFLFAILKQTFLHNALVLGDFRSLLQIFGAVLAKFSNKQIVLSEDGLISNIADMHGYTFDVLNDGGIRRFKKHILKFLVPTFERADRITTQVKFLESLNKNIKIYDSTPTSSGLRVDNEPTSKPRNCLIFIGQFFALMGVDESETRRILQQTKVLLPDYSEYLYSKHPRDSSTTNEDISSAGWELIGPMNSLDTAEMNFDIMSCSSTALIDKTLKCKKIYIVDIMSLQFKNESLKSGQVRAQKTLKAIADANSLNTSYLSFS